MNTISRRGLFKMGAALAAAPSFVRSVGAAQRPRASRMMARCCQPHACRVNPIAPHSAARRNHHHNGSAPLATSRRGDVHIQGKHIVAVGRDLKVPAGAQVIDAAGTILIPGFVDCHRHSWSAQFRRIIPDGLIANYMATTHQGFATVLSSARHVRGESDDRAWLHRRRHHVRHRQFSQLAQRRAFRCRHRGALRFRHPGRSRVRAAPVRDVGQAVARGSGPTAEEILPSDDQLVTLRAFANPNRENWAVARSLGLKIHATVFPPTWFRRSRKRSCWDRTSPSTMPAA